MDRKESAALKVALEQLPYETPYLYHGIKLVHRKVDTKTYWIIIWQEPRPYRRVRHKDTISAVLLTVRQMLTDENKGVH